MAWNGSNWMAINCVHTMDQESYSKWGCWSSRPSFFSGRCYMFNCLVPIYQQPYVRSFQCAPFLFSFCPFFLHFVCLITACKGRSSLLRYFAVRVGVYVFFWIACNCVHSLIILTGSVSPRLPYASILLLSPLSLLLLVCLFPHHRNTTRQKG